MTRRRCLAWFLVAALGVIVMACGDSDAGSGGAASGGDGSPTDLVVSDASIALPAGANSAIYFTIDNRSTVADRLIEVRTVAGATMLHETRADDDGLMRMHHVDSVEIGAGETVVFAPGGLHVMVLEVAELAEGDTVAVELIFERGGALEVAAVVRSSHELIGE